MSHREQDFSLQGGIGKVACVSPWEVTSPFHAAPLAWQSCSSLGSLSHAPAPRGWVSQLAPGQDWALNGPPIPGTPAEKGVSRHKKQAVLTSSIGDVLVCTWLGLTCSAARCHVLYKAALNRICMSFGDVAKDPLPMSPFPFQLIF